MAKLYYRYGAMNSGKSTAILQVAYNYEERDQKVILLKPKRDTKGGNQVVARMGIKREVDYLIDKKDSIKEICNLQNINCILVDEAQFLTKEQVDELFIITKAYNIPVICYGLKTDSQTNFFEGSKRLFELADSLEEMKTICRCGSAARFNARIVNGEFVSDGEQVVIDGENDTKYESLCGKCYLEKVKKLELKNIK